eukprot:TRINITY_DN1773_c0_g1_i1.p1 TRINITY_DN1773_c0_g1~~TRINITY_DN1773_c0_g1_i1.p1  ORF type:complete len:330 (+),score=49.36 TRINITY_DN1773_c0_g1_i1:134-991(+)
MRLFSVRLLPVIKRTFATVKDEGTGFSKRIVDVMSPKAANVNAPYAIDSLPNIGGHLQLPKEGPVHKWNIKIETEEHKTKFIEGTLSIPEGAKSMAIYALGSGLSFRSSPVNMKCAKALNSLQIATFLIDLQSPEEVKEDPLRPNVTLMCDRLCQALYWVNSHKETSGLKTGLIGGHFGAASVFRAASIVPTRAHCIACKCGRPGLSPGDVLRQIKSPTLFIFGENDNDKVKRESYGAYDAISTHMDHKKIVILPGSCTRATHFTDAASNQIIQEICQWFSTYLK